MGRKGLLVIVLLIALQCLFISTASAAQTTIGSDAAKIDSAVTWSLANSPYIINSDVTIETGGSLTIEPGVVVKFSKQRTLYVEGTLNAQGAANNPIYFTDYRDDVNGVDSNGDGNATSPAAGSWGGINVEGTATMNYCVVRYGGYYYNADIKKTGSEPLTLSHLTISDSSVDGLMIDNDADAAAVNVNNCTIQNNKIYGIHLNNIENDSYVGTGNTINNNLKAPVSIDGGTLKHEITWRTEGSPYLINGDITVDQTGVLNISPSVVVKFAKNRTLYVEGTLTADGNSASSFATGSTDQNTIYFTDYRDDVNGIGDGPTSQPAAGCWGGINISGGGNANLSDCVVRYAGYYYNSGINKSGNGLLNLKNSTISDSSADGVYINNDQGSAVAGISNCAIKNNNNYGIHINNIETDSYVGNQNSITNNGKAPICVDGGTLSHNITWSEEGSPYYIVGDITVSDNAVLAIDPGVAVKFAQSKTLYVNGTLTALGNLTNNGSDGRIYFTSYKDDSAGGDTNGDNSASQPAAGWWGGIYINNEGTATLDHCVVRYGGYYYNSNINKSDNGALNLTNSEISNSSANGLSITDNTGVCTIAENKIFLNKVGIYCRSSNPVIGGSAVNANQIYSNTDYGVQNNSDNITVNAKYNYWGSATGPTHTSNPSGTGDKVSDYVDFGNFLTAANNSASLSLNKNNLTLNKGASETLIATTGSNTAANAVWKSSRTDVAAVDQTGKVTGVSSGTAVITVTSSDGSLTATCTVTVKDSGSPGTALLPSIPVGTVIFSDGYALSLVYANDPANTSEVIHHVTGSNGIYIITFSGSIIDNSNGNVLTASQITSLIPAVTYKDADGNTRKFSAGNGPEIGASDNVVAKVTAAAFGSNVTVSIENAVNLAAAKKYLVLASDGVTELSQVASVGQSTVVYPAQQPGNSLKIKFFLEDGVTAVGTIQTVTLAA